MKIFQVSLLLWLSVYCNAAPSLRSFENTPENVARLRNLQPDDLAEELSGQFEGDMILTEQQYSEVTRKNGMIVEKYRWPMNIAFYEIEEEWFDQDQISYIHMAMRLIETSTCVRFQPRNPDNPDYIRIHGNASGCSATVGHIGGSQTVKLQPYPLDKGCFKLGSIVHEFIHALGFRHMQSTFNRDEYVEIVWDNIQAGKEHNFLLYASDQVGNYGAEYDYGSVMHYSSTAFSENGEKTIVPLKDTNEKMGQRDGMSEKDIFKINSMYDCFSKD
ncbi:seminal metalloprotease 1-like [Topomyia yanbarensis]|uniref:seminal metalloprotease 1-like n=1 Tax=Topomyia yanbarensis TaxID=2498891 RepID=UPI00273B393F|nr:seminal metalloprotease 1-like [Topomyia yanbarensis]